jgi:hypothetical protein
MMKQEIFKKAREFTLRYENIQPEEVQELWLPKAVTDRLEEARFSETGLQWPIWAVISGIIETFLDELTGNISRLEYLQQSPEHQEAFRQYCDSSGLRPSEQAAEQYFDRLLKEEEKAHTEGLD